MAEVDPSRVIQKLALRIANEVVQSAMKDVAMEDAEARAAELQEQLSTNEG